MKVISFMLAKKKQTIRVLVVLAFWYVVSPALAMAQGVAVGAALIPNDPDYPKQNYLDTIQAPAAWDIVEQHLQQQKVVIAVLDTGVDIQHPDLVGSIWTNAREVPGDGIDNDGNSYVDDIHGWDFVDSKADPAPVVDAGYIPEAVQHGTIVAGLIAATANNGLGIAGAAYQTIIMPLRVLDSKGAGNTTLLAQAIDYAVENGADIINLSLVGDKEDPVLDRSIAAAYRAGVAVVAASGNQEDTGVDLNQTPRYPVCEADAVNRIIGVAALDSNLHRAPFSNYGSSCIDIAAPGVALYSTQYMVSGNDQFPALYGGGWSGTSVSAPLVSATLANIKHVAPNISLPDMYRALLSGARSLDAGGASVGLGVGVVDMAKSVQTAFNLSRSRPTNVVLAAGKGFEPRIIVKDTTGVTISEFDAYAKEFHGGVSVATGDVDGDGQDEIVTAPLSGGGPHIRIFDLQGNLKSQFMAYDVKFRGGVSVAVGDIAGDGVDRIITAPLVGGGPHIRIFDSTGVLQDQFMAYSDSFRGGVRVAVGDVDRDGLEEIVTVPASAGGPHVKVFNASGDLKGQFFAFESSFHGGLTVGVGDLDGDSKDEIVVAPLRDTNVQVRIFDNRGLERNRFLPYSLPAVDEQPTAITVADFTGDGRPDIISYPIAPGGSFQVFDYFGQILGTDERTKYDASEKATRFSFAIIR